ncbi:MAG: hypothetical protein LBF09_02785, partial [Odoribacteraceae bacterium]|nr:hypothetical protein [Odoribacteraceae bacterium]
RCRDLQRASATRAESFCKLAMPLCLETEPPSKLDEAMPAVNRVASGTGCFLKNPGNMKARLPRGQARVSHPTPGLAAVTRGMYPRHSRFHARGVVNDNEGVSRDTLAARVMITPVYSRGLTALPSASRGTMISAAPLE